MISISLCNVNCISADVDQFPLVKKITIYKKNNNYPNIVKEFYNARNLTDVKMSNGIINPNIKNLRKIKELSILPKTDEYYDINHYYSILLEVLKLPELEALLYGYFHESEYEHVKSLLSNIMFRSRNIVNWIQRSYSNEGHYYISSGYIQ